MNSNYLRSILFIFYLFGLVGLTACHRGGAPVAPPMGMGKMPTEVSIVEVMPERIALANELPGRLEASRVAEVRARAAGIILKRTFREGSLVKAGQTLFEIDPAPLKAAYQSAQAALAKTQAGLSQANIKVKRYHSLVAVGAVSRQDYDDAIAIQKQAQADLSFAKAARHTAQLNLEYATVKSPISGRIGRALVTEGALVGQGQPTLLAVVQQIHPIYMNLTQSSADLLRLQQEKKRGVLQGLKNDQAKVSLVMEDGQPYSHAGKLLFSDISVDLSTGVVILRAEFPNAENMLLPGMYVRAKLEQAVITEALTVPQQAVVRGPQGTTVYVVNADNKVVAKPVVAEVSQGNRWIVSEGLRAGDQVVVEGFQKIQPGAVVKAVPWHKMKVAQSPVLPAAGG